MLLIFVPLITPRIEYVFKHVFGEISGIEYTFTTEKDFFTKSIQPKISYCDAPLGNELFFYADGLLEQSEIHPLLPETGNFQNTITLFPNNNEASALPYDIFSAVFYMLSRYEEYLPFTPDKYGRFEAAQSMAHKHGFLQTAVVDIWIKQLEDKLTLAFPEIKLKEKKYCFTPTYDIDIAYSYKHKGFLRSLGGLMKDALNFNFGKYFGRLGVLLNINKDPFDTYDFQFELQEKFCFNPIPIYFFHPGTYGKYDKNCSPDNKHIRKLIKAITDRADFGIHPSYLSTDKPELLAYEMERLEKSSGKKITKARQHFIRIHFPETYRSYIQNGITDDYSMGFATEIGFRAGTSQPFYFFDLIKNESTGLLVHPFVFMDGVYIQYHQASPEEINEQLITLISHIKEMNGTFISLFHNNSFCETPLMIHWRKIYEDMLKSASEK